MKPDVTRVHLFGGSFAGWGERVVAEAPAGLEPGSPFGELIAGLVIYLNRRAALPVPDRRSVPRPRGDEPGRLVLGRHVLRRSPPTRG